jgi:acyl-CoA synthetase (AMP-forming)/AMP-acid ligase II/acyl carrier protein
MSNGTSESFKRIPSTILELAELQDERQGDGSALIGLDRVPLSYAALGRHLSYMVDALNAAGIGRGDRVAVVLPNGPEMALAFLGVAACATCAPLNPAYHAAEFEFYLRDLKARALLIAKGDATPAREVAHALGVPVMEIETLEAAAGLFGMSVQDGTDWGPVQRRGLADADDVALILHTSGTTSRPKIVPLTQRNLCASAHHVAATLQLKETDLCLNVMPLFHIHGLIAALLATLASGGATICTPGFDEDRFFTWINDLRPTWYTAVPTMHQAVLARAEGQHRGSVRTSLRFIRSSSSALPPQVMERLERCFGVPVIEAYGMTEAAHQMASNPLPPAVRKPRSVGIAAGPEVAVMGDDGTLLPPGRIGEIVIRGANVTRGYEENPQANAEAFCNGWFRTGDQGELDAEGYLFITGRIKELINRGGEKVSPREVDEVLMDHPDVMQAVAFAVPHPTLGEDLAAAVVPKAGRIPDEAELRKFTAERLSNFKVPTRIVLVAEIPKGPTGKLQRIGLADRLVRELAVEYEAPVTESEQLVARIFEEVLLCPRVGRNDNFFALGGESIGAARAHVRLAKALGIAIQPTMLFRWPTVALLASQLDKLVDEQEVEFLSVQLEKLPRKEALRLLDRGGKDGR